MTEKPVLDVLLAGNRRYVETEWDRSDRELVAAPALRLAVVACMDTRHNVEKVLGLRHGDAKVVRNAGNLLDDGTMRSLVVAVHLLGVRHVAILGHTQCGMTVVGRGEFRIAKSIAATTSVPLHEAMRPDFQRWLGGFDDPEQNVRRSVEIIRNHPLMPRELEVMGLLYDNHTGRVSAVSESPQLAPDRQSPAPGPSTASAPLPAPTGVAPGPTGGGPAPAVASTT